MENRKLQKARLAVQMDGEQCILQMLTGPSIIACIDI